jgi:glycosyltransferase involved in cell wall biosynthesis
VVVHQLLPSLNPGDATGTAAVQLQRLLRRLGHAGELYAGEVHPSFRALAGPASGLRPGPSDWVLYHHGIASPLAGQLLHLPCRRGVIFHNISPAPFYRGTSLERALAGGRAQLAALAPHVDLSVGVSAFNAEELREAGHRNVHVVPLFVEPERFEARCADAAILARLSRPGLSVLTVSRVVPHKRMEDLLALQRELLRLDASARLLVAGGYDAGSSYVKGLRRELERTPGVVLLGKVSHGALVAAYRSARVFVSMSEHEGFGVPLVEAMAADLPVVAYAAAAVPETLGGAGVGFTGKHFAAVAELVRELHCNAPLREKVLAGQRARVRQLSAEAVQPQLQAALRAGETAADAREGRTAPRRPPPHPAQKRPRVGVLVQRYGEVAGGAEAHARMVVERMAEHWDITVLTSCAEDHLTWKDVFPPGRSRLGAAEVLRFEGARPRVMRHFNAFSRQLFGRPQDLAHEQAWIAAQGPVLPGLYRHLAAERGSYDGFVAFTYLYASTAWGLPMVADRCLLVPTAHDEPPFQFDAFGDVFRLPRCLVVNTPEEEALIAARFPRHARARVVGVGVEAPAGDGERFRARHGVRGPYLLYVGRMEAGKNVPWLLRLHAALRRRFHDAPALLLAGAGELRPAGDGVRCLGRIDEQDKWDGLAGALAVVVPSQHESLSLLALEGMSQGAPLLANAGSAVLAGQARRSGAGVLFSDEASFAEAVQRAGAEREQLSRRARAFAARHGWDRVVAAYREEMDRIMGNRRQEGRT